jgi:LPXTG-motif cell wall-anchored protein
MVNQPTPSTGGLMLKYRLATVAVLVAVFSLFSVSSASAQYAPCSIELDVDPDSLEGAGSVDGEASSDVPGQWSASNDFNGQTDNGSGDEFDFSFSFPEVDDETEVTISVLLVREDNVTCTASETITLGGEDDDDGDGDGDSDGDEENGGLPDTGGSNRTAILAGIALVLAGGGTVFLARRRNEDTA